MSTPLRRSTRPVRSRPSYADTITLPKEVLRRPPSDSDSDEIQPNNRAGPSNSQTPLPPLSSTRKRINGKSTPAATRTPAAAAARKRKARSVSSSSSSEDDEPDPDSGSDYEPEKRMTGGKGGSLAKGRGRGDWRGGQQGKAESSDDDEEDEEQSDDFSSADDDSDFSESSSVPAARKRGRPKGSKIGTGKKRGRPRGSTNGRRKDSSSSPLQPLRALPKSSAYPSSGPLNKSNPSFQQAPKTKYASAMHSDHLPPFFPHFTTYLSQPPAFSRRSAVVTKERKTEPRREEIEGGVMKGDEIARRVRVLTKAAFGMTPWEAWAGEGWRPGAFGKQGERLQPERNGWQGVERDWEGMEVLDREKSLPYLPPNAFTSSSKEILTGLISPGQAQIKRSFPTFGSASLENLGIDKKGCVFNPGGPVWGMDWCPMTEEESEKRNFKVYLALSAHPSLSSPSPIGHAKPASTPGSIQIWSVCPPLSSLKPKSKAPPTARTSTPSPFPSRSPPLPRSASQSHASTSSSARPPFSPRPSASTSNAAASTSTSHPSPRFPRSAHTSQPPTPAAFDRKGKGRATRSSTIQPPTPRPPPPPPPRQPFPTPKGKERESEGPEMEEEDEDWDMEMKFEMAICVEGGAAWNLKWCPLDSSDKSEDEPIPKLGILAGTFEDGSIKLFAVPDPDAIRKSRSLPSTEAVYLKFSRPLVTLGFEEGLCWCLDWGSSKMLAAGGTNGCVALWDVQSAAHSSPSTSSSFTSSSSSSSPPSSFDDEFPLPTQYLPIHTAPIRSLSFLRAPQADALGNYHLDWEQTHIISLALNGRLLYTDLRDAAGSGGGGGASVGLRTSRSSASTSTAVSIQNGSVIVADGDYSASVLRIRTHTLSGSGKAVVHQGNIWSLATSDYHPNLASSSADGSLLVTNTMRGTTKNKATWVSLMEPIYRIDRNERTGEIRMLENILPQNLSQGTAARVLPPILPKLATRPAETNAIRDLTPAWHPDVGVLCATWNSGCGIGRAGMLASGMACGLGRVDWVKGEWKEELGDKDLGALRE